MISRIAVISPRIVNCDVDNLFVFMISLLVSVPYRVQYSYGSRMNVYSLVYPVAGASPDVAGHTLDNSNNNYIHKRPSVNYHIMNYL